MKSQRLRKICPECNSLSITARSKSIKKYKCRSCNIVFGTPRIRMFSHREIALRAC